MQHKTRRFETMLNIWLALALLIVLAIVAMGMLALAAFRLRTTTLVAPLCWAIVALVIWLIPFIPTWTPPHGSFAFLHDASTMLKFAALCSFCPTLAILGARRPQHGAWQFIVLTFLGIAAMGFLPQTLAGNEHEPPHVVWQWFYLGLIVFSWINYFPTRFGFAATLLAIGQSSLLADFLPFQALQANWRGATLIGAVLLPAATILAVLRAKRSSRDRSAGGWNRVWRDFRDFYGVVWALRVMERTNALAKSVGVAIELDWSGFHLPKQCRASTEETHQDSPTSNSPSIPSPAEMAALESGLRTLLRRFVSNPWIDARLAAAAPPAGNR